VRQVVIENPVINSPFREPDRHFQFPDEGITNKVIEGGRSSSYFVPIARPREKGQKQLVFDTEYFLGMLTAAYNEFEARVGTITSARGAKREIVRRAIERLPDPFTIADLRRACAGVSLPTLKRTLTETSKEGRIKCLGAGPGARWVHRQG
jgi:hypothetical protein